MLAGRRDRTDSPSSTASSTRRFPPSSSRSAAPPVFTGPIGYKGQDGGENRHRQFHGGARHGKARRGVHHLGRARQLRRRQNQYYKTDEAFLFALADALREEYKAILDAGLVLQLDDPGLPDSWDMANPEPAVADYKKFATVRIEALNHALQGLPEERIRYHICWGSWHGPHTTDLPLASIVDMLLKVRAACFSVEAGNVRHEHEWKVWREVKLPPGKLLMPGVVSHATNVIEHPELVSDRILRFASVVGRENVIAGTDCGLGGRIHPQLAWAKLQALVDGARLASKELWR